MYNYSRSRWLNVKTALFIENATSTIHTATFGVPKGWTILDIIVVPEVLWTATGTVVFKCGDANASDGYFSSVDLKATDLILGERLQAASDNFWGATQDAYLTTAGRFGQAATNAIGGYMPAAYSVIGVVTVGTPATTVGRLRMTVISYRGTKVTPVLTT